MVSQSLKKPLKAVRRVMRRKLKRLSQFTGQSLVRLTGSPYQSLCHTFESMPYTPELVIQGVASGLFANQENETQMQWNAPETRGIILMNDFHVRKRTRQYKKRFDLSVNQDYAGVIRGCANRNETWIGAKVIETYEELHQRGFAHSIEVRQDGVLVGGLIGIAMNRFFTLESLFHTVDHASKVAFAHLGDVLQEHDAYMIDFQGISPLAKQFGAIEVTRDEYITHLTQAIATPIPLAIDTEKNTSTG